MRIQITGSRECIRIDTVMGPILDEIGDTFFDEVVIVHGGARGADRLAALTGELKRIPVEKHPADWDRYGKSAGYRRNAEMVALGADVCLAFFKRGAANKGTQMMVDLCKKAGIPVKEFWEE